jgi:hypothetical protein
MSIERWLWLCPVVGLAAGIALLWLFGLTWLSALGIAFLVSCPAMAIWTLREARAAFGLRDRMLDEFERQGRR